MEEASESNVDNSNNLITCAVKEEQFRDKMFLDMDQGEVIVDPGLRFDLFPDQNSVSSARHEYVRGPYLHERNVQNDWNNFDNYYGNAISNTQFYPTLPPPPPPPSQQQTSIILDNHNMEREQYQFYQQPGMFYFIIF